jgi:MraZ protein
MFLGTHAPKLDDKGRVILPARFRDELHNGLVLTRGQERCIYVFTNTDFEAHLERLREAPLTSKAGRDFLRLFLSGASSEIPDKQNRVTIPQALRDYAGLEKELTVIGAGNRAEIWSASAWETYYQDREQAFSETEEEVIPGLL